jgi:hypothetical protein
VCGLLLVLASAAGACGRGPVAPTPSSTSSAPAQILRIDLYEGPEGSQRALRPGADGRYRVTRTVPYTARIYVSHSGSPDRHIRGQVSATFYVGVLSIDFVESTQQFGRSRPMDYMFGVTEAANENKISIHLEETGDGLEPQILLRDIPVRIDWLPTDCPCSTHRQKRASNGRANGACNRPVTRKSVRAGGRV